MRELIIGVVAFFLTAGTVWGQGDFETQAKRIFSSSILESIKINNGNGEILFKDPPDMPSYFRTGDKINKVFAIESARLFRDVLGLESLKMTIPLKEETHVMSISRKDIDKFYGLNFSEMKGNLDAWRNKFIRKYDNKKARFYFAVKFAKSK